MIFIFVTFLLKKKSNQKKTNGKLKTFIHTPIDPRQPEFLIGRRKQNEAGSLRSEGAP